MVIFIGLQSPNFSFSGHGGDARAAIGFRDFQAIDVPNDGGGAIELTWEVMPEVMTSKNIAITRRSSKSSIWEIIGEVPTSTENFIDESCTNGVMYAYLLQTDSYTSKELTSISSRASWFDMQKINLLILALIVLSAVVYYVSQAGTKDMFIRRISGLQAVEEAVGRATEMGRSVLFIPGIQDLDDVQTLAGLTILSSVAKLTAEYETKLDVPVSRSMVMSNGREVVKEAFLSAGRPDFYHDGIVHYVTDEQFGYVAAVDGIMVREKPAACFYMGAFFAESLILAETGNHIGAIQIAGTAMPTQLPFFVAACDYTLIGEELFAASAYLSGDKRMIASLRGQDVGKVIAMGSILLGSILMTFGSIAGDGVFMNLANGFRRLFALNF